MHASVSTVFTDDARNALADELLVQAGDQGQAVDVVGVQAELDPVQVGNELCIAHGKTQTRTGQLPGLGKSLHHQQVLVLVDEGHAALAAKVHIGLVHDDHIVRVCL